MKLVSIVIPARNEEQNLPACLASIGRIDYPQELVETVVIDNGSTDRTRQIARDFGATVISDDRATVAGLRNLGVTRCTGEIVAFVDADCVVAEDWLGKAARYFDCADITAWGAPPAAPENGTWVQQAWYLVRKKADGIQDVDWLESMNLFCRRVDFLAGGGFDERLVTCEDVDFCYRMRTRGRIVCDSAIRVEHRGEAATLAEFVRKELWRGRSNWQGMRSHGLKFRELPSLMLPAYMAIAVPSSMILPFALGRLGLLWLPIAALAVPVIGAVYKLRGKGVGFRTLPKVLALLEVYFWTRTIALLWPWGGRNRVRRQSPGTLNIVV